MVGWRKTVSHFLCPSFLLSHSSPSPTEVELAADPSSGLPPRTTTQLPRLRVALSLYLDGMPATAEGLRTSHRSVELRSTFKVGAATAALMLGARARAITNCAIVSSFY